MLVLERAIGKKLMIGKDIVVTMLDFKSGCILLAIDAEPEAVILDESSSEKSERIGAKKWLCMISRYESVWIAKEVKLVFIRPKGAETVLLGVDAPRHITVLREEIVGFPRLINGRKEQVPL